MRYVIGFGLAFSILFTLYLCRMIGFGDKGLPPPDPKSARNNPTNYRSSSRYPD